MSAFFLLQAFIASDITFAMKPYFRGQFCSQDVREGLVAAFIRHIAVVADVRNTKNQSRDLLNFIYIDIFEELRA